MLVDRAIYADGRRTESCSLGEVRRTSRQREGFAWVGLFEPSEEVFGPVTRDYEVQETPYGTFHKWCPGCLWIECDYGETVECRSPTDRSAGAA